MGHMSRRGVHFKTSSGRMWSNSQMIQSNTQSFVRKNKWESWGRRRVGEKWGTEKES